MTYLVLSRSCAGLHEEFVELFADHPEIEVIVDRRRGSEGMAEIPASGRFRVEWRRLRRQAGMTLVLPEVSNYFQVLMTILGHHEP